MLSLCRLRLWRTQSRGLRPSWLALREFSETITRPCNGVVGLAYSTASTESEASTFYTVITTTMTESFIGTSTASTKSSATVTDSREFAFMVGANGL